MEYVIGIDGGGTKTLLKISDIQGNLISVFEGGPSNINSASKDNVIYNLTNLIENGISNIKEVKDDCRAICLGTAGAGREEEKELLKNIIKDIGFKCSEIIIADDAVTALYANTDTGIGIVQICGTGSICYGRNKEGTAIRCGGWGHIIGDEGSAYYIGVRALNAIMKSFDGRERETLLTPVILKQIGLSKIEDIINYVYKSGKGKKEIAGLAKCVDEAYLNGDNLAKEILYDASRELFISTKTVIEKLGFAEKPVNIIINGSVITKNNYINKKYSEMITENYPLAEIKEMKNDSAWGAVLIALEKFSKER